MKKEFNFVGNRKRYFIFSIALIVIVLLYSLVFGVKMDIEFKGGSMITYSYEGAVDVAEMDEMVEAVMGSTVTTQIGSNAATGAQNVTISLPSTDAVTASRVEELDAKLAESFPDNHFAQQKLSNVAPTMGKEFFLKCLFAVVLAFGLILVYIAIRFKNIGGWPGGVMAIIALIHDMFVIFGVFVIMGIPLNSNFVAAVLTILGFSINDTVVIYDRVRENRQLQGKNVDFGTLINMSINQSMNRSINTSVATVLALGAVSVVALLFGLDDIFTFSFPLIIGMISGVYSTICIAGPLWVEWELFKAKRATKKK